MNPVQVSRALTNVVTVMENREYAAFATEMMEKTKGVTGRDTSDISDCTNYFVDSLPCRGESQD